MKLQRRDFLRLAAGAAALPTMPHIAKAQAGYPNRIVRMVVGFPAGGGADAVSRIISARLSELLGQQVVVENKPGAGSNLALDHVANSPADGYTIIMSVRAPGLSRDLFTKLSYDPDAFAPVSRIGTYTHMLVVPKDHPAKTMQDFIAHAKANPGKVTFASPGIGTPSHLTAEYLKTRGNFDMTHVAYRGVAAGAMNDLMANRIDAMVNTTGSLLQHARSGNVRGLAVTSAKRSDARAGIPDHAGIGRTRFRHLVLVRPVHAAEDAAGHHPEGQRRHGQDADRARDQGEARAARHRSVELDARATRGGSEGRGRAVGAGHQGRQHQERLKRLDPIDDPARARNALAQARQQANQPERLGVLDAMKLIARAHKRVLRLLELLLSLVDLHRDPRRIAAVAG